VKLKNRNILIISPFFSPELISTGKFNTDMALALRDEGHHVTILCSHPLYPKWKTVKSNEQIPGIKILRGGLRVRYPKKIIFRRAILEVWFASFVLKNIFNSQRNQEIIVPVFPPSLAFYLILPFLNKKIIKVGIVHDLQEVYSSKKKGIFNKIIRFFINKIEKGNFNTCDKLIFLSSEMKDTAKEIYALDKNKLQVQYPFVTKKVEGKTNALANILFNDKINIVYSGALGEKQNPEGLYAFFDFASKSLKNVHFHFFSQGHIFDELKDRNLNSNIKFHDLVEKENLWELYERSTIQIVPQLSGTSKGSLPSKLPNLLASDCQILVITDKDSEIENIFKTNNFQKVITSWENNILLNAVEEILSEQKENDAERIKICEKIFNIDSLIKKIVF
jgi:glycosyltransferase involved in cell wall biosynthesis